MSHLPKRTLYDILVQRQRVLRGREETWLERHCCRFSVDLEAVGMTILLWSCVALVAGMAALFWKEALL